MNLPGSRGQGLKNDPLWYKDAVIYELRTRSFYDSNGDGIGDLTGLVEKLDYLSDLGVTALWLLPLCPSPGKDDGYDISEYMDVHPDVGTIDDVRRLVTAAHARGIRVITELVMNHTSDQHPWFQRARRAPAGSPERDFYVWTDNPDRYREARIIFKDFEPSNWSWDRVANAYFWHRFFSHQPDLNFDNPAVHEAMLEVVDFWYGLGVDGLRLDAVPYLYEEDGTSCENLPKTHAFLKKLRAHIDAKWQNRMLLAEANQWPEDAAAYFGDGDECHMNFHFPIMPRMFMAIAMEDRFPILDILAQTPALHPSCQWAMFLRNHDELTLEMVTDEERDYMYRAYADEPAMRINLGIRRRLAPLVGNDRRKMELLNGLLFALPGTPVLYYGDEIGMGDNVYLGDRNGVRTPMQWSADRNAGFSRANPQRLILPIVIDPEYHYETINVEAQHNNSSSLLWWTKRLVALRRQFKAFGRGSIEFLSPDNPRVLAFIRELDGETILVVANLSRFVQYVELDLSKYEGRTATELFGKSRFPKIGTAPYPISLGEHAFYWFSIDAPVVAEEMARRSSYPLPTVEGSSLLALTKGDERGTLEEIVPSFLFAQRWFRGRGRVISRARFAEAFSLGGDTASLVCTLVSVEYREGAPETYALPLAFVSRDVRVPGNAAIVATARLGGVEGAIVDALQDAESSRALLEAILHRERTSGARGDLIASTFSSAIDAGTGAPKAISAIHANASIQYGDKLMLKVFRFVEDGRNPELEMGRFLSARAPTLVPELLGALEYKQGRYEPSTIAALHRLVPNEGTAWEHAQQELGRFYERILTKRHGDVPIEPYDPSVVVRSTQEAPPALLEAMGTYTTAAVLLGKRTAEMHIALASSDDPAFAPEPYSPFDRRSLYQSLRNVVGRVVRTLRSRRGELPPHVAPLAKQLLENEGSILVRFEPFLHQAIDALRTRTHGDYHLAQVLHTGKDFVIIDFDGGRDHALAERRRKRSPLRDVAGMIRSFHYAAYIALADGAIVREADHHIALPAAGAWYAWASAAFVRGYRERAAGEGFLPKDDETLAMMIDRFVLAKAFHELGSELEEPSDRIAVPLGAIVQMLGLATP